ncbi:MAG: alpha-amylase family glycosyl hydrolase [Anaerolineales bacterium]
MGYSEFVKMEFHISRQARDYFQFDQSIFNMSGNVIFANFHAARLFANKMNERRDLVAFPEKAVRAGQINAMGLIDEILHLVIESYREQRKADVMEEALTWVYGTVGEDQVKVTLRQFGAEFPPIAVYRNEMSLEEYLAGESIRVDGKVIPNQELLLEEMLLLWLANGNPAFSPYSELFDDETLERNSKYKQIITSLHDFFDTQPFFGPDNQNLVDMLRSPAIKSPHSLTGQLDYIRSRWGSILGDFLYRLLRSLDLIKEEEKVIFGVGGGGPSYVYDFTGLDFELERFSRDKDWMPNLVLVAKNIYVWLDQLSKQYRRSITKLDQVPDEEIDKLARWGFTGLWLIGVWERSQASRTIKQLRGNPEAVASAYSLFGYDIAADLGGDEAYQNLRDRAWQRGIRMASDMVPNHMGIDSRWVMEHPDWFISLDYSPFPSYNFDGPNLSWDERVGIFLEDHYFDNSDAAVVFKRVDFWAGSEKYIYHGNDGTSMPWNDTAQLNYLIPEVREAVIQTILHVARQFPIIRFDAAMTLAKRHYQRLWYPEPGSGGDIPSRAEHGMTKDQFNAVFPEEFWREVVDRVAQEVPDTLLLAEAFWLMEGFFVRTLGMHRVYNSAFMNMLRDEKNQEYRLVIKNTIEFEPEILKRYVNFMNNPDERTAVDQFGKDDKYFGICTMMVTMPGLPMIGHGQVEGFTEKYGMEYRKAYWDEQPDSYLVERHEREIFPLMRHRYLFAEVKNFLLYDFFTPEGNVNEDVFVYSNQAGDKRGLVVYHNKYAEVQGWIRISAAYPQKSADGDKAPRELIQKSLGEGLGIHNDKEYFTIFRDHVTGLEYIHNSHELHTQGLYIELAAYQFHVFLDFYEVQDNERDQYAQLAAYLDGRGVPSIEEAVKEIALQPVRNPYQELVNAGMFNWLIQNRYAAETYDERKLEKTLLEVDVKAQTLLREVKFLSGGKGDDGLVASQIMKETAIVLTLSDIIDSIPESKSSFYQAAKDYLSGGPKGDSSYAGGDVEVWGALLSWLFTNRLGFVVDESGEKQSNQQITVDASCLEQSRTWIDEWLLGKIIAGALKDMGIEEDAAWRSVGLIKSLTSHQDWFSCIESGTKNGYQTLKSWLQDVEVQRYIQVHRYKGVLWFNKEAFEELIWWMFAVGVIDIVLEAQDVWDESEVGELVLNESEIKSIISCFDQIKKLERAKRESDYQLEKLLDAAGKK